MGFLIVSLLGIFTILALIKFMPKLKSLKTVTFKEEIEFFSLFKAWHIILIVAIGFGGLLHGLVILHLFNQCFQNFLLVQFLI